MTLFSLREDLADDHKNELVKYPDLLQRLLFHRGIATANEAEVFLNPSYERDISDPFLMHEMEKAASRVVSAIQNNERICIYSDYDADGIPGGVLFRDLLKKIGFENFFNYIPDRHFEGYGLSVAAIEKVSSMGAEVVISIDCGIVDFLPAQKAKDLGIDLIITDHHLPAEKLPDAYAVVNPKIGDKYPDKMLCGAGVAWKLCQAVLKIERFGIKEEWEKWLLDMAGLSTIADMVPLRNENRAIAHFGLRVLRRSPRSGLIKLLRRMKVDQKNLSEDDVSFMIVPRINAASRMDVPMKAFELLSTDDETSADILSKELEKMNDERKGVVASMVKEIHHKSERFADKSVIVIGNPDWRPGLLGLVANSVMEHYKKPVFVWGRDGQDGIKGSCRSDGSVNVVELMKTSVAFADYGGHKFAGGFSVSGDMIHTLENEICIAYEKVRLQGFEEEVILADAKLQVEDINLDTYRIIERLEPFGEGNPKPVFLLENVIVENVSQFGKEKNHINLSVSNGTFKKINGIAFFSSPQDFKNVPEKGKMVNIAFHLEKSTFRGYPEIRMRIIEVY